VVYRNGREISKRDVRDADAMVVRTRTRCDAELLRDTRVRFIASATIGFDHIDAEFCRERGIEWTSAPGCNSSSVLQYIASALFELSVRSGFPLKGKTIGVVGVGNVGGKVASFCELLGMRVLRNDPPRERSEGGGGFVPLQTVLDEADIVTLHVPLNPDGVDRTFHLLDDDRMKSLRNGQILINSSRGEVIETGALKSLLARNRLSSCVLDVWENEPEIDRELLSGTSIATPHIAGYSADGKGNGTAMSVRALGRFFGLPLTDWYPADLPRPSSTEIEIDGTGLTSEETVRAAVCGTYDLAADDRRLRDAPEDFERQRAEYPLRREFPVYTVRLRNADPETESLVRKAGFQVINPNKRVET
jgi:erythronate-4-phosphate dehydrogenase